MAQTPHSPETLTEEDYEVAEKALSQHSNKLVYNGAVRPNWINNTHFWYRNHIPEGEEFILVDIEKRTKKRGGRKTKPIEDVKNTELNI